MPSRPGQPAERDINAAPNRARHVVRLERAERDAEPSRGVERHVLRVDFDVDVGGDRAIARIAAEQRGLVTRAQLLAAGLSKDAIAHRLARQRLHRVHRGVYTVGHPVLPPLARELAAVLACGAGAVLSHGSAADLWGFREARGRDVHVTVSGRHPRNRRGVRVHRVHALDSRDIRRRQDIPVTGPARTLVDLAPHLPHAELERALEQAQVLRLTTRDAVLAALSRAGARAGARALRRLLALDDPPARTRSEAERRLLKLIRDADLPRPAVNARLGRYEVDFLWRGHRLVVEVDGYAFHSTRAAFERDRLRDAELQAAGYRVMRLTWRQVVGRPEAVVARLAMALGSAGGGTT